MAGLLVDTRERLLRRYAADARKEGARLRERADSARRNQRSGNPAKRAAGNRVDVRDTRRGARALDAAAEGAEKFARRLPIVGLGVSALFAGSDIANGESPSKVGVGEVAGVVGGVGGAAAVVAVVGVGAPVIAVAAGAAVVGVGASLAAEWAYEEFVPRTSGRRSTTASKNSAPTLLTSPVTPGTQ